MAQTTLRITAPGPSGPRADFDAGLTRQNFTEEQVKELTDYPPMFSEVPLGDDQVKRRVAIAEQEFADVSVPSRWYNNKPGAVRDLMNRFPPWGFYEIDGHPARVYCVCETCRAPVAATNSSAGVLFSSSGITDDAEYVEVYVGGEHVMVAADAVTRVDNWTNLHIALIRRDWNPIMWRTFWDPLSLYQPFGYSAA